MLVVLLYGVVVWIDVDDVWVEFECFLDDVVLVCFECVIDVVGFVGWWCGC